eukprot:GFYU01001752.1.p1 GENE.GFYU01001752.1~~GFYU01001752.1.p1  ORF type:complete len:158 (+),score=64.85 GFYU01001752.1:76-549(+)
MGCGGIGPEPPSLTASQMKSLAENVKDSIEKSGDLKKLYDHVYKKKMEEKPDAEHADLHKATMKDNKAVADLDLKRPGFGVESMADNLTDEIYEATSTLFEPDLMSKLAEEAPNVPYSMRKKLCKKAQKLAIGKSVSENMGNRGKALKEGKDPDAKE